jgi:phosphatidylserine/phosphatidylglycerophosphate/cardiolipin synthase-like enzyme
MQAVILSELAKAKTSVHLSLYGVTNRALANALIRLHKRGVSVVLLVDMRQAHLPNSLTQDLKDIGIPVIIKPTSELEHYKYCIIDHQTVIMGSWNWSNRADKQDNSDIILGGCPQIVQAFETNFNAIKLRDTAPNFPQPCR